MKAISPDRPWLAGIVQKDWTVIETGSGGSTVFFAQRAARVISFEHDAQWAAKTRSDLAARELGNATMQESAAYPQFGLIVCGLPMADLIFIDGRGRVKSVQTAIDRLKPGGFLVLDDSDRDRYVAAVELMDSRCESRIVFRGGADQTTAWRI